MASGRVCVVSGLHMPRLRLCLHPVSLNAPGCDSVTTCLNISHASARFGTSHSEGLRYDLT